MAVDTSPSETEGESDHENNFHASHVPVQLCSDDLDWLADSRFTYETVVSTERLRREYERRYFELMKAMSEKVKRVVLAVTTTYNTTTYTEIHHHLDTTKRTVKNHVHDLRDADVLHVGSGSPAAISFVCSDLRILAEDVLSFMV